MIIGNFNSINISEIEDSIKKYVDSYDNLETIFNKESDYISFYYNTITKQIEFSNNENCLLIKTLHIDYFDDIFYFNSDVKFENLLIDSLYTSINYFYNDISDTNKSLELLFSCKYPASYFSIYDFNISKNSVFDALAINISGMYDYKNNSYTINSKELDNINNIISRLNYFYKEFKKDDYLNKLPRSRSIKSLYYKRCFL